MKRIVFFLLLALFPFAVGAQTFNVTSSATVTVGAFFYAGTSASTTIAHSTLTTAQQSFKLIKPDLSINPFAASTTGDNRCTALASGWYQLEIEAAQKSQVGLYQVIAEASGCINPAPSTWFQVVPDAIYSRDYVSDPVGGWIAAATATLIQVTPAINISSLPTTTWMSANVVHPASRAFLDLLSGFINFDTFMAKSEIVRTFPGISSDTNIATASGQVVGASTTCNDYFSGVTVQRNRIFDSSKIVGDRYASFDIGSVTVEQWVDTNFSTDVYKPGD